MKPSAPAQTLTQFADKIGAVHAVKMQRRHALGNQPLTNPGDHIGALSTQRGQIVLERLQPLAQPARDFRAAGVRKTA